MPLLKTISALLLTAALTTGAYAAGEESTLVMETKDGPVTIELYPDVAPNHVERLTTLANEGFYDGLTFHRVIEGFMAQTGDPQGTGMGGSSLPDLDAEFSDRSFERGTLGMARSSSPNSANSQFFIMFAPAPHLDGQYTVVGQVTDGMDKIDAVKRGSVASNGTVVDPDTIVRMRTADQQ